MTLVRDQSLGGGLEPGGLLSAWRQLRKEESGIRIRDAAARLGVSEAELVAARSGQGVVELEPRWAEILRGLPSLGEVMVLTRNEFAVHEKVGRFDNVDVQPGHALVVNRDIDLRLFLGHWRFGFAVEEQVRSGRRRSLQFFDIDGTAVHKVYLREASDLDAYSALVQRHARAEPRNPLPVMPLPAAQSDRPDDDIDVDGLKKHWSALQDTHDFMGMLREFGVGRVQALRLAGPEFAWPVGAGSLERVLEAAAASKVSIMCFVGNAGCIQIHTGPVHKLKRVDGWYNVLDPGFNLHVATAGVASEWLVRKPTRDGDVTALEIYDNEGQCILRLFGERKPGSSELQDWTRILNELSSPG
jgi:putative hemin transport protein